MTSSTHVRPDFDHTFLLSPVDADLRSGADHGIFVQCEVSATPGDAEFLAFSAGQIIEHVFTKKKNACAILEILSTRHFNRRNFWQARFFAVDFRRFARTLHAKQWRTAASPITTVAVSSEPPNRFPAAVHHCHRRGPLICCVQAFLCIRIRSETAEIFVSLIRRCARLVMFCRRGPHKSLDE